MKNLEVIREVQETEFDQAREVVDGILQVICGPEPVVTPNTDESVRVQMTKRRARFASWGVEKFFMFATKDNNYGVMFIVSGLKFEGMVRIILDYGLDSYTVQFLKGDGLIEEYRDVFFDELQEKIHEFVEE